MARFDFTIDRDTATTATTAKIADAIDLVAKAETWPATLRVAVKVSVDEVLANLMMHVFSAGATQARFGLETDDHLVRCTVIDDGPVFDISDNRPERARTRQGVEIGGRGLVMVQRLMDAVQFERVDGWNRVTLTKRRAAKDEDKETR